MPRLDGELKARLLATFKVEADEHLESISANLLALDGAPQGEHGHELVDATFREMHTLKGAARSVGRRDVEQLCQACESLLSALSGARVVPGTALLARLEEALHALGRLTAEDAADVPLAELVDRLERVAADPASADAGPVEHVPPPASPARQAAEGAIRMPAAKLDELLRHGDDLLAIKLAADDWVVLAETLADDIRRCREQLARGGDVTARLGADLRALEAGGRAMIARLRTDRRMVAAAVDGLLDETRRARMTPASTSLDVFPRMVRDLAQEAGKEVEWVVVGGELEIDRHVLDSIKDPLIHLVRNAVDHGIEPPEERAAAGKPRRGRVTATVASLDGGRAEIVIEDDGRGIDAARVREAARRARPPTPAGEEPPDGGAALDLVFLPGVSTSFVVTDVSGRGLGLAIVKEQIERLGGEISVDARPGSGLRMRLVVPLAIATFRGLPVRAGGQLFLLPLAAVERVVDVEEAEPAGAKGRRVIELDGEALPVASLDVILDVDAAPVPAGELAPRQACAIISVGDARAGIRVDEVLSDREVLVKAFAPPLVHVRHIAGAGLLGAGELALILRPADLVEFARDHVPRRAERAAAAPPPARPATILVVDDALTTRAMERSMLELAGYEVDVAVDGLDAWAKLERGAFDLVVSDVDMPHLNGFELTARIRADARLAELPVVLVTALEGREDQERGLDAGANAYVVKSSFEQSNLLETIRRLGVEPGDGARR